MIPTEVSCAHIVRRKAGIGLMTPPCCTIPLYGAFEVWMGYTLVSIEGDATCSWRPGTALLYTIQLNQVLFYTLHN